MTPDELAALAASGELGGCAGVGEVTASASPSRSPARSRSTCSRLEATEGTPLDEAAGGLRAAVRGDCHSHTDASDGGSPLPEMVETRPRLGHEYLVITDHSPRLTVANGLSAGAAARAAPRRSPN